MFTCIVLLKFTYNYVESKRKGSSAFPRSSASRGRIDGTKQLHVQIRIPAVTRDAVSFKIAFYLFLKYK